MTVSSTINRSAFLGNGSSTAFATVFPFIDASDVAVFVVTIATGAQVQKTRTAHYTVSGGNGAPGTITFLVAPASGERVILLRDPPLTQLVDLVNNSPLDVDTNIERPLDRGVMIAQRNRDLVSRTLRQMDGDVSNIAELPAAVERASKFLAFDGNSNPIASEAPVAGTGTPVSAFMATVLDDADAAAARDTLGAANVGRLRGVLNGFTLSNNGTDATNDIDIAAGSAVDSTHVKFIDLASALTKRLDAAWAVGTGNGGLDTGSIANGTYAVWAIMRSDTGVVDVLFSTSFTAPTMPADYDYKAYLGAILRESAAIVGFTQNGDEFLRNVPINSANTSALGAAALAVTLQVPVGLKVRALIEVSGFQAATWHILMTSMDQTDTAASATVHTLNGTAGATNSSRLALRTNALAQIRARSDIASTSIVVVTQGWIDDRGRNDA